MIKIKNIPVADRLRYLRGVESRLRGQRVVLTLRHNYQVTGHLICVARRYGFDTPVIIVQPTDRGPVAYSSAEVLSLVEADES